MGIQISRLIQETSFLNDPTSENNNIDMARTLYGEIPVEDKHRAVTEFLSSHPEI